jgi:uncharacterized membrane protein
VQPRVGQVLFLVVAAFLLTNKVYSPQYVVWLIPLAVLARPRWRDLLIWQGAEVVYFVSIWLYLAGLDSEEAKGLSQEAYAVAILIHVFATLWLCGMVVRDVIQPRHDPVRNDGSGEFDPLAGPFAPRVATDCWPVTSPPAADSSVVADPAGSASPSAEGPAPGTA